MALREIRKFQKSFNALLPRAFSAMLVKCITQRLFPTSGIRWTSTAVLALQEAAEAIIVHHTCLSLSHLLFPITLPLPQLLVMHWFICGHHADQSEPVAWLAHTSAFPYHTSTLTTATKDSAKIAARIVVPAGGGNLRYRLGSISNSFGFLGLLGSTSNFPSSHSTSNVDFHQPASQSLESHQCVH